MDRDAIAHDIMRDACMGHSFFSTKSLGILGVFFSHGIHIHIRAHFSHRYTNAHTTHTGILTCTMGGVSGWELAGFLELLLPLVSDRV